MGCFFYPFPLYFAFDIVIDFHQQLQKTKKVEGTNADGFDALRMGWSNQTGRLQLECRKDHFLFRTEVLRQMNPKGRNVSLIFISVPFYVPIEKELIHAEDIIAYLKGKSLFVIEPDMA